MNTNIAKRYVKAILSEFNQQELDNLVNLLNGMSNMILNDAKFSEIINSLLICNSQKTELLTQILDKQNQKVKNLFKILAKNKRLNLIPEILSELQNRICAKSNIYNGKVHSKNEINKGELKELEEKFSKKFGATINLESVKSDYNGIKIDIEGLGVEASFSVDRLKNKMCEYILKAI